MTTKGFKDKVIRLIEARIDNDKYVTSTILQINTKDLDGMTIILKEESCELGWDPYVQEFVIADYLVYENGQLKPEKEEIEAIVMHMFDRDGNPLPPEWFVR